MLRIETQRFGTIVRPENSVIHFSGGIFGFELQHSWLLLADSQHGSLYWLQSAEQANLALSVVDPREFVHDYELKMNARELQQLPNDSLIVLTMLTHLGDSLTLNLRNPVLICPAQGIGRQVVATSDNPLYHELPANSLPLRRSA